MVHTKIQESDWMERYGRTECEYKADPIDSEHDICTKCNGYVGKNMCPFQSSGRFYMDVTPAMLHLMSPEEKMHDIRTRMLE